MATAERSSFGHLLRRYRLAAGLTHEALAERAQLSVRGISDLERGVRLTPRQYTIRLLAEALGLSPRERAVFTALARGLGGPAGSTPFRPLAADAAPQPDPTAPPLVGRDQEMELLERHLRGQGPSLLLLAGMPGIGKSRLLQEAARRAGELGLRVLASGCQRRGGQEPYAPLLAALEGALQRQEPVELRRALQGCAWLVRLLPELADGPIEPLPAWQLTPDQERRLIFRAVARLLSNLADPAGMLLVLDDLQWAGADALDLLTTLAHAAPGIPLRVVGAYRDTEAPPDEPLAVMLSDLARVRLATRHALPPLTPAAATALIDALLGPWGDDAPAVREWVVQRANGVPLFIVSCAEALRLGEPADEVPGDVAESVRQRAMGLPVAAREVLATAAVIGRVVPFGLLVAVAGRPEAEVLAACEAAGRAGLLAEAADQSYRFAHDIVREAIEVDLSLVRRTLLHRRIAEALEQRWAPTDGSPDPPVVLLAYHYERGGARARAVEYLVRAAERARQAAAHREEAALLGQAIDLAEQTGQRGITADLRVQRGQALFNLGLWADARRDLEAAIGDLAPGHGDRRMRALLDLAIICHWLFDAPSTRRYVREALALAEALGRDDLAAAAIGALAFADSSDGDLTASLTRYRQALAQAGPSNRAALVPALEMSTLVLYWLGDYSEAIARGREAVQLAREVYHTTYIVRSLGNLGMALTGSGRYAEAVRVFEEARWFVWEREASQWLARSIAMQGGLHLEVCDFTGAEALAEEAREMGRSSGFLLPVISAGIDLLLNLARRRESGDRIDDLLRETAEAAAAAASAHGWLWRLRLAEARSEVALACDRWHDALRWADDALAQARVRGRGKYEVAALVARAQALAGLGRTRQAIADLRAAGDLARPLGDPALCLRAAVPLLMIQGDDALAAEAIATARRIAAALPDDDLRRRFAAAEPMRRLTALTSATVWADPEPPPGRRPAAGG